MVWARTGRVRAISVFYSKSIMYGAFVWTHGALNGQKRRFPARADEDEPELPQAQGEEEEEGDDDAGEAEVCRRPPPSLSPHDSIQIYSKFTPNLHQIY